MSENSANVHISCSCPLCCPGKYGQTMPFIPSVFSRPPVQYGWVCPKCEGVYSPSMVQCLNCAPVPKLSYQTTGYVTTLTKEETDKAGFTLTTKAEDIPGPTCE